MKAKDFFNRLKALVYKEFLQLIRDKSSIILGIVVPIMLILLIGYGMSLDVKHVPIAVVLEDSSPTVYDMVSFMNQSEYFSPQYVTSMKQAEQLMKAMKADAILLIPSDFTKNFYANKAVVQLILYGVDSASATSVEAYVSAGISQWAAAHAIVPADTQQAFGNITIVNRTWFNDADTSTWFLVPGLIVFVTTMVGIILTALVMAREWERGTLEALFVTPVKVYEILLAKIIPYFFLAFLGFSICLLASKFLYHVPLEGSLLVVVIATTIYLFATLGIGLVISSITKNQFLASQMAFLISFLPTFMLSGFLFDLQSVPAVVRAIGQILPATYFMELAKSLFLAGNNWPLIQKNCLILLFYAIFFLAWAQKVTKKRIE